MTRGKASCGLSWSSAVSSTVHGLRSVFNDLRPVGSVGQRVVPTEVPTISDNKTGQVVSETLGRLLTQFF